MADFRVYDKLATAAVPFVRSEVVLPAQVAADVLATPVQSMDDEEAHRLRWFPEAPL